MYIRISFWVNFLGFSADVFNFLSSHVFLMLLNLSVILVNVCVD